MIRRVVEYMIHCDAEQLSLKNRCDATWHAFSSMTQKECAESAAGEGWKPVTKRFWLCPQCAEANAIETGKVLE